MKPFVCFFTLALSACAISHPCRDGGDIDLPGITIKGNMRCQQKEFDGKWKNNGHFEQKHLNGVVGVEGEFIEGHKEGIWLYYTDDKYRVSHFIGRLDWFRTDTYQMANNMFVFHVYLSPQLRNDENAYRMLITEAEKKMQNLWFDIWEFENTYRKALKSLGYEQVKTIQDRIKLIK